MMREFLRKVPLFDGLSEEDFEHLCEDAKLVSLTEGETLVTEGEAGDTAYVIQTGELEVFQESGGREVFLAARKTGEVIGEMAVLEESPRTATLKARTDSTLIAIGKESMDHLLSTSISAANAMFHTMFERYRGTEVMLRQSEKMAQLGTLTAGVAHELNNPAAAVKRGADQLQQAVAGLSTAEAGLGELTMTEEQSKALQELGKAARERSGRPSELDALARSDREYEFETWLEDHGVDDAWEIAPALVNMGYQASELESLAVSFSSEQLPAVVGWLNSSFTVHNVMAEVGQGAERISEIVKALKGYSYLDQAPVQNVDLHEGLDNTLLILRSKLTGGIIVRREYASDLPKIEAYGSELNQVWTNLIDNAADALEGQGEITIRTRTDGDQVVVEIEDNGPGIPPEVQPRIFDSFFTTKPPGKGTGLGLDISYNIVVQKHRGDIQLDSRPGKTQFQVSLPLTSRAA